jgi:hypothetical protein
MYQSKKTRTHAMGFNEEQNIQQENSKNKSQILKREMLAEKLHKKITRPKIAVPNITLPNTFGGTTSKTAKIHLTKDSMRIGCASVLFEPTLIRRGNGALLLLSVMMFHTDKSEPRKFSSALFFAYSSELSSQRL